MTPSTGTLLMCASIAMSQIRLLFDSWAINWLIIRLQEIDPRCAGHSISRDPENIIIGIPTRFVRPPCPPARTDQCSLWCQVLESGVVSATFFLNGSTSNGLGVGFFGSTYLSSHRSTATTLSGHTGPSRSNCGKSLMLTHFTDSTSSALQHPGVVQHTLGKLEVNSTSALAGWAYDLFFNYNAKTKTWSLRSVMVPENCILKRRPQRREISLSNQKSKSGSMGSSASAEPRTIPISSYNSRIMFSK